MKLHTTILFVVLAWTAAAQEKKLTYANTPTIHANPFGSGFIVGPNGYGDTGKYQRFDFTENGLLNAVSVYMGYKEVNGSADSVEIVVRSQKDSVPDVYLFRKKVSLNQFVEFEAFRINLPSPVAFSAGQKLFAGVEWADTNDDLFAILADADGEGNEANRSWERYNDGSFHALNENSSFSWHLDADVHMEAHYTVPVPTFSPDNETFTIDNCTPNPVAATAVFWVNSTSSATIRGTIIDCAGRPLMQFAPENLPPGRHAFTFNAGNWAEGVYLFRLTSSAGEWTKTFVVKH